MARRRKAQKCSEPGCPNLLVYPEGHDRAGEPKPAGTKTCSTTCRGRRARRIKAARVKAGSTSLPAGMSEVSEVVTKGVKDAAHEVMKEELRPLVREQMTTNVLESIGDLINTTPAAILKLQEHIESNDEAISQRAVTLLLKYTMGNPSVAPPSMQAQPGGLTVVLGMPRPDDTTAPEVNDAAHSEAATLRVCMDCDKHKPDSDFVGQSSRCQECFDGLGDMVAKRFGQS